MNVSKNILITGVSTGIGYACCQSFLASGYRVFGSVRTTSDAERLAVELGAGFTPLLFDVTDHTAIEKASKELTTQIGEEGLAGLINNAGIAVGGPMMHMPMKDLRMQFEINVFGLVKVTQAFLPLLGARKNHPSKPGKILNISSVTGKLAMPFLGPYTASKHALEAISSVMRRELMLYGIDVVTIGPGAIKTPIWNKGMDIKMDVGDYSKPLELFSKRLVQPSVRKALEVDDVAEDILAIFEKSKPKTRYAIVAKKFTNWIIPLILPDRFLDKYLGKKIGL